MGETPCAVRRVGHWFDSEDRFSIDFRIRLSGASGTVENVPGRLEVSDAHGLRFHDTQFWVIHRRSEYGPFDYEWSPDFRGVELTYRGAKFGEICSIDEIYADLREFRLPMRVVEVASVVFGCMMVGMSNGYSQAEREALLVETLHEYDCADFIP